MSLINCINQFGKAVDQDDADFMRERFNRFVEKGMSEEEAGRNAIREFTQKVDTELDDIVTQVEKAGGTVARPEGGGRELFVFDGDEAVNADELIKSMDDEIAALDDIVRCAYK